MKRARPTDGSSFVTAEPTNNGHKEEAAATTTTTTVKTVSSVADGAASKKTRTEPATVTTAPTKVVTKAVNATTPSKKATVGAPAKVAATVVSPAKRTTVPKPAESAPPTAHSAAKKAPSGGSVAPLPEAPPCADEKKETATAETGDAKTGAATLSPAQMVKRAVPTKIHPKHAPLAFKIGVQKTDATPTRKVVATNVLQEPIAESGVPTPSDAAKVVPVPVSSGATVKVPPSPAPAKKTDTCVTSTANSKSEKLMAKPSAAKKSVPGAVVTSSAGKKDVPAASQKPETSSVLDILMALPAPSSSSSPEIGALASVSPTKEQVPPTSVVEGTVRLEKKALGATAVQELSAKSKKPSNTVAATATILANVLQTRSCVLGSADGEAKSVLEERIRVRVGFYRHYKRAAFERELQRAIGNASEKTERDRQFEQGNYYYKVVGIANHTEQRGARFVVYYPVYRSFVYENGREADARPVEMFTELIQDPGASDAARVPRFQYVDDPLVVAQLDTLYDALYNESVSDPAH